MQGKRERRRLWGAILGSLFVHLVAAFSLAAFNRSSSPLPDVADRPLELTMMDLAATPPATVPANPAYIETDPARESAEEPEEKTFESNANSRAASSLPATGDAPLPSQEGKDRPFIHMETQQSSLASEGATAQPAPEVTPPPAPTATATAVAAQTPKPQPTEAPTPVPLPEPSAPQDQLAMLTGTPPPPLRDPDEAETPADAAPTAPPIVPRPRPESPASAYQPEKQQTRIRGRISDRGAPSVNAVGTPLGRYQKLVSDAIGSRWYYYTKNKMDLISIGTATVEAEVDANGKLQNLRLLSNDANEAFANICLQSFQEAQIPPIPPELVATLPDGRLQVTFSFTLYAN